jgi:hypothetical protein
LQGEHAGLKFPEFRSQGPHLRSQEMKMPTNIGQKKLKAIETVFEKLKIGSLSLSLYDNNYLFCSEPVPIGSEEVARDFNELRSDAALLYDLKSALQGAEFELQSLRNRYQAITGKVCRVFVLSFRASAEVGTRGVQGVQNVLRSVSKNRRCQRACLNRLRVCRFAGSVGFYPRAARNILYLLYPGPD